MDCIVNYHTQQYINGATRLKKSVEVCEPNTAMLQWNNNALIHPLCPEHHINPYAFKVYAMEHGAKYFNNVFWMDSSCYLIKPMTEIWSIMETDGYFMQECGHMAGRWMNDNSLTYFELSRKEAMQIPMFTAGCFGLNFNSYIAKEFFRRWRDAMLAGIFRGNWNDHRHDMACGSVIAHELKMQFQLGSEFLAYATPEQHVNESIVIKLQGIN